MKFRRRTDRDFEEELKAHLELEADRRRAEGVPEEEARRLARRDFGSATAARERFYESRHSIFMDEIVRDTRYALRTLARSPGYAAAAILTLALGIGANTAIFSATDEILLRPPDVPEPAATGAGLQLQPQDVDVSFELLSGLRGLPAAGTLFPEPRRVCEISAERADGRRSFRANLRRSGQRQLLRDVARTSARRTRARACGRCAGRRAGGNDRGGFVEDAPAVRSRRDRQAHHNLRTPVHHRRHRAEESRRAQFELGDSAPDLDSAARRRLGDSAFRQGL